MASRPNDDAGVAGSTGERPSTEMAMTRICVDFCRGVGLTKLDVLLGFSLGGMIALRLNTLRWCGG
jgi:hypothetical protein